MGLQPDRDHGPARLWRGTPDNFGARPAMAEHLRGAIICGELRLSPDGHLSILTEHVDESLDDKD